MHLSGRLAAAIEVIADVTDRHRPVNGALSDWGKAHRFAGSSDRAAIGNIVYDIMRQRALLAAIMGSDTPRALVLACAVRLMNITVEELAELCVSKHGPGELTQAETEALSSGASADASPDIQANIPDWLMASFEKAFGGEAVRQGEALSVRAPVDIRANLLKTTREKLLGQLSKFDAVAAPFAPDAIRIEVPEGLKRTPTLKPSHPFQRGAFEIQDAASQIAARMCAVEAGQQVADICAGAGGKTLGTGISHGQQGPDTCLGCRQEQVEADYRTAQSGRGSQCSGHSWLMSRESSMTLQAVWIVYWSMHPVQGPVPGGASPMQNGG